MSISSFKIFGTEFFGGREGKKKKTLVVLELSKHEMTVFSVTELTAFYLSIPNGGDLWCTKSNECTLSSDRERGVQGRTSSAANTRLLRLTHSSEA